MQRRITKRLDRRRNSQIRVLRSRRHHLWKPIRRRLQPERLIRDDSTERRTAEWARLAAVRRTAVLVQLAYSRVGYGCWQRVGRRRHGWDRVVNLRDQKRKVPLLASPKA